MKEKLSDFEEMTVKKKVMDYDILKEIEKQTNAERIEALTKALFHNGWEQKSHFNDGPYCTVQEFALEGKDVIILLSQDIQNDKYKIEIQIGDYMGISYELCNTTTPFNAHDRHIQFYRGSLRSNHMTFDLQSCTISFYHSEERKDG